MPVPVRRPVCRCLPALLLAFGVLSGGWVLAGDWLKPGFPAFTNTATTTLVFLLAGATVSWGTVRARYQWGVVAGLGFSAIGDALLMQTSDWFVPGLSSFLLGHLCYLWALTSDSRPAGRLTPFAFLAAFGTVFSWCLWPGVPTPLRVPVLLYTLVLLAMAGQALTRAMERRHPAAWFAAVGAVLFVASDSLLAFQRFRHPLEWGRVLVLGTYFAAQAGIAASVVFHRERVTAPAPVIAGTAVRDS